MELVVVAESAAQALRRVGWIALVLASSGCDRVFGLEGRDSAPPAIDVSIDASPCPSEGLDEDGDGVFDVCDNCPTRANPGQLDSLETANGTTADGIGDDCDPDPGRGNDYVAHFYSFALPSDELVFTPSSSVWTMEGGTYTIRDLASHAETVLENIAPAPIPPYVVETEITISAIEADGYRGVGLELMVDLAGVRTQCSIARSNPGNNDELVTFNEYYKNVVPLPIAAGSRYRLTADYRPLEELRCDAYRATPLVSATEEADFREPRTREDSRIGFRAAGVEAQFHYLIVYAKRDRNP